MQPIFLFSLPRSGSTLAQRILGAHQDIATSSEPWILLPFIYMLRGKRAWAEYDHRLATDAIEDFYKQMPGAQADYLHEIRECVLRLYAKAAPGKERYFLDKTPRYHLIASEVRRMFPDAKYVFLWRNPLAMLGSYIDFFGQGKWNLYAYEIDLFRGLDNLISVYKESKDNVYALRYEDLVNNSAESVEKLVAYLELPYDPKVLESFSQVKLEGRLGDYKGSKSYGAISREPLEKWKLFLGNPLRKRWALNYIEWIGSDRLAVMGYSLEALRKELNSIPLSSNNLISDAIRMTYGRWFRKDTQYYDYTIGAQKCCPAVK